MAKLFAMSVCILCLLHGVVLPLIEQIASNITFQLTLPSKNVEALNKFFSDLIGKMFR